MLLLHGTLKVGTHLPNSVHRSMTNARVRIREAREHEPVKWEVRVSAPPAIGERVQTSAGDARNDTGQLIEDLLGTSFGHGRDTAQRSVAFCPVLRTKERSDVSSEGNKDDLACVHRLHQ